MYIINSRAMKILNLDINNRRHYSLNFDKGQSKEDVFIIKEDSLQLFSFRDIIENSVIIHTEKNDEKVPFDFSFDESDGGITLNVLLGSFQTNGKSNKASKNPVIRLTEENKAKLKDIKRCKTVIKLRLANHDFERSFTFVICKKDLLYTAVLDFGSEASQMAIFGPGDGGVDNIIPIFDSIKGKWEQQESKVADDNYVQYVGDPKLYRSVFYIKKAFAASDAGEPWKNTTTGLVNFLSKRTSLSTLKTDYISLPNPKIASFGGVSMPRVKQGETLVSVKEIGEDYFYRFSFNIFVRQILENVSGICANLKKAVNLIILMPNVYSAPTINKRLSYIQHDIDQMLKEDDFKDIMGVEISYISESDASLLGAFAVKNTVAFNAPQGNYLIMDAGKGTLDFSILQYNPSPSTGKIYKNLCRSGIIGAGNALSYAFALSLAHEFIRCNCNDYDKNKVNDQVRKLLFSTVFNPSVDLAELNSFLYEVERYKIRFNENNLKAPVEEKPTPTINLDAALLTGFTNFISGLEYPVPDDCKYIENEINEICLAVMTKLLQVTNRTCNVSQDKITKIDKVVFTGRGFLLKAFRDKVFEYLKAIEPNIEEADVKMGGHEKDICLFVSRIKARYDVSPEDTPLLLVKDDVPDAHVQNDSEKKALMSLAKVANVVFPSPGKRQAISISVNKGPQTGTPITSYANIINIGGTSYPIPDEVPENALGKKGRFFFDGEEFRLVINNEDYCIQTSQDNLDRWLAFESLFPNIEVNDASQIILPGDIKEKWEKLLNPTWRNQGTAHQARDAKSTSNSEPEGSSRDNLRYLFQKLFKKNKKSKI